MQQSQGLRDDEEDDTDDLPLKKQPASLAAKAARQKVHARPTGQVYCQLTNRTKSV